MDNKEILRQLSATGNGNIISVGNGLRRGKPVKIVGVKKKKSKSELTPQEIIPQTIGNKPQETDVIELGEIVAL